MRTGVHCENGSRHRFRCCSQEICARDQQQWSPASLTPSDHQSRPPGTCLEPQQQCYAAVTGAVPDAVQRAGLGWPAPVLQPEEVRRIAGVLAPALGASAWSGLAREERYTHVRPRRGRVPPRQAWQSGARDRPAGRRPPWASLTRLSGSSSPPREPSRWADLHRLADYEEGAAHHAEPRTHSALALGRSSLPDPAPDQLTPPDAAASQGRRGPATSARSAHVTDPVP